MKKIISILAFTSLLCCSCDYLDVVPEGKATEEDIWKTTEQADKFRYYLQTYMPVSYTHLTRPTSSPATIS
mgnify:CR=1 FL=1